MLCNQIDLKSFQVCFDLLDGFSKAKFEFFLFSFYAVLLTFLRSNLLFSRSIMEKVELLLHLRGNMHHYPGAFLSSISIMMLFLFSCFLLELVFFWSCLLSIVCIIQSSDKRVVSAGHVYYIQITQYRIQQRLPMIFLSVVSKKLRSRIWTGIVGSLSLGYQFKFPKVSKVCFAYDCL